MEMATSPSKSPWRSRSKGAAYARSASLRHLASAAVGRSEREERDADAHTGAEFGGEETEADPDDVGNVAFAGDVSSQVVVRAIRFNSERRRRAQRVPCVSVSNAPRKCDSLAKSRGSLGSQRSSVDKESEWVNQKEKEQDEQEAHCEWKRE
jgi:hypothetical protein